MSLAPSPLVDAHASHRFADAAVRRRAFTLVFLVELWERFGFYGMAALMVLFMVQALGYDDRQANLTWGVFSALVYAAPVLGGWVGDHVLGARRAMACGVVVLGVGYATLALASLEAGPLYAALSLVVVGNGLFKPNAANLVRRIYECHPARIDSAFTLYYMAVNVGSTASMLATPWVGRHWGWQAAFGICALGLACGLANCALMSRAWATLADDRGPASPGPRRVVALIAGVGAVALLAQLLLRHARFAGVCMVAVACAMIVAWGLLLRRCAAPERAGMHAAGALTLLVGVFFVFYQQMSTSMTLFALRNVEPELPLPWLPGLHVLPAQFQAFNPLWIMALAPLMAWLYTRLARGGGDLPMAGKFALGFAAVAGAFGLLAGGALVEHRALVPAWLLVGAYGMLSLGELLISGLGLAMITRYVPARLSGVAIGCYFAMSGLAMYVGSLLASLARVLPGAHEHARDSLHAYLALFGRLSLLALAACGVSLMLLPWLRRCAPSSAASASTQR